MFLQIVGFIVLILVSGYSGISGAALAIYGFTCADNRAKVSGILLIALAIVIGFTAHAYSPFAVVLR